MPPSSPSWVTIRSTPPSTAGPNRAVSRSTCDIPLRKGTISVEGVTAGVMSSITAPSASDFTASSTTS